MPKQTCKNYLRQKQGCKLMDQIQTVQQSVCASLGRSLCHGNEHHGIDPNILSSGHHNCSTKTLFLSAQLSNCNIATCWHIELSIPGLLHFSLSIHLINSFNFICSMKFFQLKITLGLALGESWPLLAQPQKHIGVQCLPLPIFPGKLSLVKPVYITLVI